ncbi:MAG: response regulator transcription factor [Parvibaculaceae bacterium]|nr:response regulator transcription factor [Parvibaculaceae bacterium]
MTSQYSFLIADDHWLVRQGLRQTLAVLGDGLNIHDAGTYDEVFSLLADDQKHFDLLLLDLSMPGATPEEALVRIRHEAPAVPLVVVSANEDPAIIRRIIDSGAAGFVPKSSPPSILVSALQLVLAGGIYVPPVALEANTPATAATLTDRQSQVLDLLAEGAPNKIIAARLGLALPTVKIHVAAVLRRLSARNRTEAVQEALRLGLVQPPRPITTSTDADQS